MYEVWDLFDLGMGQGMQESAPTHPFRALRWISACSRKAWVRMLTTDAGGGSPRVCRCRALCVVSIRLSSDCILASNSASLSLVAGTLSIRGGFARKMFLFRFFVLIFSKCSSGRVLGRGSVFMGGWPARRYPLPSIRCCHPASVRSRGHRRL